jgi:hypothetical protein
MTKMKLTQNYSTKLSCFYYDTVSRMSSRVVHWGLVFQIREVKYLYLFEILIGSQRWSLHCIQSLVGLLLGKVSVTCNRKPKRVDIMKCWRAMANNNPTSLHICLAVAFFLSNHSFLGKFSKGFLTKYPSWAPKSVHIFVNHSKVFSFAFESTSLWRRFVPSVEEGPFCWSHADLQLLPFEYKNN